MMRPVMSRLDEIMPQAGLINKVGSQRAIQNKLEFCHRIGDVEIIMKLIPIINQITSSAESLCFLILALSVERRT
jgi:hypothetical protein